MYKRALTVTDDNRVIVIGSGPAGAAATLFLRRAGVEVLLLEAGTPRGFSLTARVRGLTVAKVKPALPLRADVTMTGDPKAEIYEELAPGGLSNHWSCAVPRFSPDDFADARRAGPEHVWPIDYADLAPWYDRVEPLLHIAGGPSDAPGLPAGKVRDACELDAVWEPVQAHAAAGGRSVVPMPYAYGAESSVTLAGTAFNAFVRLLKPLLARDAGVTARFGAQVMRLEWSRALQRVSAVVYRDARTGGEERVPCRGVVLAAGALNSAAILLQSQSPEFPAGLGNTHDVLGRYFHDHPLGKLSLELARTIPLRPPIYLTRASLDRTAPLYDAACMQWSGASAYAKSALRGKPGRVSSIGFSVFGTMAPIREDRIALDPSKPGLAGRQAIMLHAHHPPESARALETAKDTLLAALNAAGWEPKVQSWRVEVVGNSVHYGGTCRMHASPEFGMINAWSRLHAVPNVAVADSAAFTTGPEKNPVLTAMALAARAGDRLAHEIRGGDL
jgi:choline dehydrogenase-like flavoprotein